jgi:hypothetical protein
LFTQTTFDVTSLTKLIVGTPLQLSVADTLEVDGAGIDNAHVTVSGAGQVTVGGTLSLTVNT